MGPISVALVVLASSFAAPAARTSAATVVTLIGAGDIASCDSRNDARTAALLDGEPGTVFTLGDNVYRRGTKWEFNNCYGPSWGRHLDRTRPAAGNHDYLTPEAGGYFGYFGGSAGLPGRGWYAYERGAWRIYVLNSNCSQVGGCYVGSRQERWLKADLAAHPHACVLAYWHHPLFSSGFHGSTAAVRGLWKTLYAAGADVVLNGHDHDYERFAPQDWHGAADPVRGLRQFVVGTGGTGLRPFETIQPNSDARSDESHGVLRLRLGDGWYRWRFLSVDGMYTDQGADTCH
jgi:acid phosphatase type 7